MRSGSQQRMTMSVVMEESVEDPCAPIERMEG